MITISNERLEKLSEYDCADRYEVMSMATELLALRKEREKEESAVCPKCGNTGLADSGGVQPWGEPILIECDCTAPPAPGADDDSLPYDPQIAEYEQMMEAEQAEADTTSQQFESLAGKAVGRSDGFECTPVADLYELLTKCGECYDYTTSAKVAADWIKEGYSAREYVKLDRLQEAMTQGSPGEADGWIPCSERMPDEGGRYWCYVEEINSLGKSHYQWNCSWNGEDWGGEGFYGRVTHWKPLPEPPCK
ncbi:DUF551 domain-containing protein [Cronobacter sakazakii]|nr:DUF551 domain-containing protein [Cronobacter sakazakii]